MAVPSLSSLCIHAICREARGSLQEDERIKRVLPSVLFKKCVIQQAILAHHKIREVEKDRAKIRSVIEQINEMMKIKC